MYKRLIILLLTVALGACNQSAPKNASKRLETLKKEKEKIDKEILQLEAKLDTGNAALKAAPTVEVKKPVASVFKHYIEVQGKVESDKNILVTPKVPGAIVTAVNVKAGDKVSKGAVLAQLDAGVASQSMLELKGRLDLARTIYEKQKKLWDQKIGSEIQYLSAKNNYEALRNNLATMQEQISNYTLRAPFNGTVDDVNLRVGEIPAPGMSGIRVVNPEGIKVTADISEVYISKIKKGDHVLVYLPDIGKEIKSTVRNVSQVINPTNRTFTIEINPDIKDMDLHPNMVAVVKVNDYTHQDVITVPVNIVQEDESGKYVYVAKNVNGKDEAIKKPVKTGQIYAGQIEILEGLTGNDLLITSGYQNVVEGQLIKY